MHRSKVFSLATWCWFGSDGPESSHTGDDSACGASIGACKADLDACKAAACAPLFSCIGTQSAGKT